MSMLYGDDRTTGTSGFVTFERDDVDLSPIKIPVTSWEVQCRKAFQDTTNSANYDSDSNLVYPTRSPSTIVTEGEIRGRFRLSRIPVTILSSLYSGGAVPKISLYIRPDFMFGTGYFSISNFAIQSPIDDIVGFDCRIVSYGFFDVNTSSWVG